MAAKLRKGDSVVVSPARTRARRARSPASCPRTTRRSSRGVNVVDPPHRADPERQGGRIAKDMPIDLSNLALADPKTGEATRVGFRVENGEKVRYAKKSGETING